MNDDEPPWNKYQIKFRREWICLKCDTITLMKRPHCPLCGGPLCVRIIKTKG